MQSERTRSLDRTVRAQAARYGFGDLNSASPSRLNRAAPRAPVPPLATNMGTVHFAPGFAAEVYSAGATSGPSLNGPTNFKAVTGAIGPHATRFSGSQSVPGPRANAVVHARHRTTVNS